MPSSLRLLPGLIALATLLVPAATRAAMPPPAGGLAPALAEALEDGLLALPEGGHGLGSSALSTWRIPVILVSFADSALRYGPADFNRLLFDSTGAVPTGSAYDYYRWVSGNRLTLRGEVVARVTVPGTRAFYANNRWGLVAQATPQNAYGLTWDAIVACPPSVNWADYDLDRDGYVDMLWVVHAGVGGETTQDRNTMWSITSRLTNGWRSGSFYTTDDPVPGSPNQKVRIDAFTMLPELSAFESGAISEIGVYCHEFGHALGLPDLYTVALFTGEVDYGPGNWSLMSSGAYGADGYSPQYPSHFGAWPLRYMGWDRTVRPERDGEIVLEPIELGGPIVELWYQGEAELEHFLIENRQRIGFDRRLVQEGLIVYHVDEGTIGQRLRLNSINSGRYPGLRLLEADGRSDLVVGQNRGDRSDPFPGSLSRVELSDHTRPGLRTFEGGVSNVALLDIRHDGRAMRFTARVQAQDWLAPRDFTAAGYDPADAQPPGRAMTVDDRGVAHWVSSEIVAGRPQVVLRSGSGAWSDPVPVSGSSGSAYHPGVAALPGGDLAVVWSDDRSGRAELYYRARIGERWTAERRLLRLSGECRYPAVAADSRGTVSVAFQHLDAGGAQVRFLRFPWFSPHAQSALVAGAERRPGTPSVLVGPRGHTAILWIDRSTAPHRLWYARYHADSGVVDPQPLTYRPALSQLAFAAAIDRDNVMHVVWQTSGPGNSQIHYQRRLFTSIPAPIDTVLDHQGHLLQNPAIAVDTAGSVHVVFDATPGSLSELRYLRYQPGLGWDAVTTRLTTAEEGSASRAQPLPSSSRDLSVTYTLYTAQGARIRIRRRLIGQELLAVEPPARPAVALAAGPNPLRAGQALEVRWSGAPAARVELLDLAGRRVAAAPLVPAGAVAFGRFAPEATRGLPPGVFFVRVPGAGDGGARKVVIR